MSEPFAFIVSGTHRPTHRQPLVGPYLRGPGGHGRQSMMSLDTCRPFITCEPGLKVYLKVSVGGTNPIKACMQKLQEDCRFFFWSEIIKLFLETFSEQNGAKLTEVNFDLA